MAGNLAQQFWERPAVVYLIMIHNDIVYLVQVDLPFQSAYELLVVGLPYGVDERGLLVSDEEGVVAGAVEGGKFVAMEAFQLPIDLADP